MVFALGNDQVTLWPTLAGRDAPGESPSGPEPAGHPSPVECCASTPKVCPMPGSIGAPTRRPDGSYIPTSMVSFRPLAETPNVTNHFQPSRELLGVQLFCPEQARSAQPC